MVLRDEVVSPEGQEGSRAEEQSLQVLLPGCDLSLFPGKVDWAGRKLRSILISVCFKTVPCKHS